MRNWNLFKVIQGVLSSQGQESQLRDQRESYDGSPPQGRWQQSQEDGERWDSECRLHVALRGLGGCFSPRAHSPSKGVHVFLVQVPKAWMNSVNPTINLATAPPGPGGHQHGGLTRCGEGTTGHTQTHHPPLPQVTVAAGTVKAALHSSPTDFSASGTAPLLSLCVTRLLRTGIFLSFLKTYLTYTKK